MKLLCFGARRFWWKSFRTNLEGQQAVDVEDEAAECVVAFVHAEARDEPDDRRPGVFRKTLKHLKQGRIFTSWINESGDDKRWCSVCRKKAVFEHKNAPAASFCSSGCARLHLHLAQH